MIFTGLNWKVERFKDVFHVGTMDKSLKSKASLEGSGLSVSLHPESWRKIARLGDSPIYKLWKDKEGVFLDFYELTFVQEAAISKWGEERGFIEYVDVYKIEWINEHEEPVYCLVSDEEAAIQEYADVNGLNEEDVRNQTFKIPKAPHIRALPPLLEISEQNHIDLLCTMDILVTVWAEAQDFVDGVYWSEQLDEEALSAPRAVIFNSRLNGWCKEILY